MHRCNEENDAKEIKQTESHRRRTLQILGLSIIAPLVACGKGKEMKSYTILNVEMFSYVDRVINTILFNGTDLGVMNRYGGTGTIMGVHIPYGVQSLTWILGGPEGTPRNDEQMKIKNTLVITPEEIPKGTQAVGLHLYPDDTAEVTFAESIPHRTASGKKILSERN